MQSFVSLHNEEHGTAVITEGVREYEIIGEKYDTIRLTLFRTFSHMGKTDLLYRHDSIRTTEPGNKKQARINGMPIDTGTHATRR